MKKIIAFFLAAAIGMNFVIIANAGILSGSYTFIDSAYSAELDMYVAMAKDLSSGTHNTQLYRSTDGINWTACFSSAKTGINYANRKTRQTLVWWEQEEVFVAAVGGSVFLSEDGINWQAASNLSASNTILETDGKTLLLVNDRTMRIAKHKDDTLTAISVGTGSRYFKALGLYNDEEKYFALDGSTWGGYVSMVSGEERTVTMEKFAAPAAALGQTPSDVIYIPQLNNWLVYLENLPSVRVIGENIITNQSDIKVITPKLSDGDNTENVTGVGVGDNYALFGTVSGKIYYAPIDSMKETSTVWQEVTAADGISTPSGEIRTISKSRDGFLLALSDTESFILKETEDGVIFADTTAVNIDSKVKRIEAPQTGSTEIFVDAVETNYFNQEQKGIIASVSKAEGNDDVDARWENPKIIFTVPDTAEGKRSFVAQDIYGKSHTFEVTFVAENDVDLEGYEIIALPEEGEDDVKVKYTPSVLASDGEKMDRSATVSLVSAPEGITFDALSNTVTAPATAESGTLILKVTSTGKPLNNKEFSIQITKRMPSEIDVSADVTSLVISETENLTFNGSAVVKDQIQTVMEKEKVKWSLEGRTEGISVDEDTGKVTVTPAAKSGKLKLVATSLKDPTVSGSIEVTLTWVDSRAVKEDLASFDDNTVTGKDLPFNEISENGTQMTFTSSDEGVITNGGVITRNRKKDTYAKVKITARKNNELGEKTINVTVLKADNVAGIGDFEDQNTEGIDGEIVTEPVYDGEYALKTNGNLHFPVTLEKNSFYVFEAYVKSDSDITLSTDTGGTLASEKANNNYVRIAGSYFYSKGNNTFDENVYISAGKEFYVDNIKVYDMTLEYEELMSALTKAEASKDKKDIESAKKLLEDFPDIPLKDTLKSRIDKIGKNTDNPKNNKTGGGGGGSSVITPAQTSSATVAISGSTVDNDEKVYEYLLRFKDMGNHWAKDDVEFMANLGIVNGVDDKNFNPDKNITRAEFAKLIVKTVGLAETEYENTYYDIVTEDWYSGYVQAAKNAGYISGYNGLFRPNDNITREEIAKIVVAAFNQKTNKVLEQGGALYFADFTSISSWAYDYVVEASREGFINGISEDIFAPKRNATRAQAVVILKRLYDKING